jgi:predicted nucleotidyltransferase
MRARKAVLRHPLDRVFSAPSHIAILRALLDSSEGMSGRQVARLAQVNHQACATALRRLEETGVVERQGSGQTQLFRLNREQAVVRDLILPLLTRERAVFQGLLRRLGRLVAGRCARAMVFGSVARGEEGSESDLDLLLIAEGARGRPRAREAAREARTRMWKEWGVRVNGIVLTSRQVELRRRRGDPLVAAILREGIAVGADGAGQGDAGTRTAAAG